jgi:fluoroquinolone transport system ATP-binding protein
MIAIQMIPLPNKINVSLMIDVTNLQFTYPGGTKPAVDNVSFSIKKGEIFGFLGPNGAGKTTTQRILIGLLKGFKGEVSILDKPINVWDQTFYEHIGVGFEFPNFYSKLTALENLQFFKSFYARPVTDAMDLLKMVGLEDDGNKKVGDYSKGMKVRLSFVRAIQHNPEILFLDEPTSGLDPANQRLLRNLIRKQRDEGKTIFLTTHNMVDAEELCDRVAFIVDGKVAVIDSPAELKVKESKKRVVVGTRNADKMHHTEFPLENLGRNAEFLAFIQKNAIETIHSQEATLEDIFIKLTGAKLGV